MPVSPATRGARGGGTLNPVAPKIFLTGDPGCGKTTALKSVVERLRGSVSMTGFLTEEVREAGGKRRGFRGRTLDGRTFRLAHEDMAGSPRVGPYGVDLDALASVGVPALECRPGIELVVVDEVGKMECLSPEFQAAVERLLEGTVPLLATVADHGVGLVKRLRDDPRITHLRMSRDGREGIVGDILRRLARCGIGPGHETSTSTFDRAPDSAARMASKIKHDVNNLLMGLLGNVALLRDRPDVPESVRQKLEVIEQQGKRIRDRIADLDSIKRLGGGGNGLQRKAE